MLPLVFCFAFIGCVASTPTVKSFEDIRIVGGEDVEITEAPYQVSLVRRGRHACGGAIVAADIIVTAAHCVRGSFPQEYQVRVGSSYNRAGGQLYPVGEIFWHPGFDYYRMDFDIAILWLSKPLVFSNMVAPITMIGEHEELADGDITAVTGWGHVRETGELPGILQRVFVPKVNDKLCTDAYRPTYSITARMLCAGSPAGGKDACQGDSGGPLVYRNKLAGIVSWGLGCARPNYPGVYTKVSSLRKWLDDNIMSIKLRHPLRGDS